MVGVSVGDAVAVSVAVAVGVSVGDAVAVSVAVAVGVSVGVFVGGTAVFVGVLVDGLVAVGMAPSSFVNVTVDDVPAKSVMIWNDSFNSGLVSPLIVTSILRFPQLPGPAHVIDWLPWINCTKSLSAAVAVPSTVQ